MPAVDSAIAVEEMIYTGTDLLWRFLLTDRKGLSASAALVLNRVNREGPMRLTALAAAEDTSQPSMTQLVQRLERQGLLERLSDPDDGRASLVAITDAGRQFWEGRAEFRRERLAALLPRLSPQDEKALWLAAQVAVPIFRRLEEIAASPTAEAELEGT